MSNSRHEEINLHLQRIAVLREQSAMHGREVDPKVLIEIRNIERILTEFRNQGFEIPSDVIPKENSSTAYSPKDNLNTGNASHTTNVPVSISGGRGLNITIIGDHNPIAPITYQESTDHQIIDEDSEIAKCLAALSINQYSTATRICQLILKSNQSSYKAKGYLAIAQFQGRSPNALHPQVLTQIEDLLREACVDGWLFPEILLAIIECDYYEYHGSRSKNNINLDTVIHRFKNEGISEAELRLLRDIPLRRGTHRRIDLGS